MPGDVLRSRARGRCRLPRERDRLGLYPGCEASLSSTSLWVDTKAILHHLSISRATLDRLRAGFDASLNLILGDPEEIDLLVHITAMAHHFGRCLR